MVSAILALAAQTPFSFVQPPYLQLGYGETTGDKVTVAWHAPDADFDAEVRYSAQGGPRKALVVSRTMNVTGYKRHRVVSAELTGLKPGMRFDYSIVVGGQEKYRGFGKAPKPVGAPFRAVIFGDTGVGSVTEARIAYRTYVEQPDLVMITGDIVYDRGRMSEYERRFWPYYNAEKANPTVGAPLMRRVPFAAAAGNHDLLNADHGARNMTTTPDLMAFYHYWIQPLNGPLTENGEADTPHMTGEQSDQTAFLRGAGSAYPRMSSSSFNFGAAHWLILDSNKYVNWSTSRLRSWIREELRKAQGAHWRFVVYHHPPFNSSVTHRGDRQMRLIAELLEEGKVDVVFAGHVHNYQRTHPIRIGSKAGGTPEVLNTDDWTLDTAFNGNSRTRANGVVYVISGAGGARLYNEDQNNAPEKWLAFTSKYVAAHSLTVADVTPGKLTIKQVLPNGRVVDQFVMSKPLP